MTADLPQRAKVRVDAGEWLGELPHNWNYIGYDEINYTYTPEGQELLAKFMGMQEKPYYVRVHHLFCTGNCRPKLRIAVSPAGDEALVVGYRLLAVAEALVDLGAAKESWAKIDYVSLGSPTQRRVPA